MKKDEVGQFVHVLQQGQTKVLFLLKFFFFILLIFLFIFLNNGSKIEATLYEELEALNHITMNEGDWFDIRNFKVMHFSGLIRLTKNRYHIVMSNSTVVVQIQPKTCSNYYCFVKFLDIARGLAHPMYCIGIRI